jgi:hypothetical protein
MFTFMLFLNNLYWKPICEESVLNVGIVVVFQMWKYPCAQVIFDSDPAPIGRSVPAQMEEMSQAMIRSI